MKSDLGVVERSGRTLFGQARRPRSFLARAVGFLGRRRIDSDEALWFERCSSIHMFGMRCRLDVVFLRKGRVLRVCESVRPMQMRWCRAADSVLEAAEGTVGRLAITPGDHIEFRRVA